MNAVNSTTIELVQVTGGTLLLCVKLASKVSKVKRQRNYFLFEVFNFSLHIVVVHVGELNIPAKENGIFHTIIKTFTPKLNTNQFYQ